MTRNGKLSILVLAILAALGFAYFGTDIFGGKNTAPVANSASENTSESAAVSPVSDEADDTETMLTLHNTLAGTEIELTEAALKALPQVVINTDNEFVDQMTAFEGPLGRDVLALAGGGGSMVVLTAVNDYAVEIPIEDFMKYDVVFAFSADGEKFSRRDKGPIWVVYPMSDNPELQDPVFNARLIWQLVKVEIK